MRQYIKDLIIFIGLLLFASLIWILAPGSAIDIQLHDTYFVIDNAHMMVLILGPLGFLIFLARGLNRKFKSIGTNAGLIISLILISLITYRIIGMERSYLNEMKPFYAEDPLAQGQFHVDMNNKISLTWGLLALWLTSIVVLSIRTIRLWKEEHGSHHKP